MMKTYLKYDKFYKHYGLHKVKDFVYPRVLLTTELVLPRNSILHYYNVNTEVYPSREIELLSNITNGYILNLFEFKEPIFEFKHINTNEVSLGNKFKKLSKDFITIVNPKKMKYNLTHKNNFLYNNVVLFNYSNIASRYRLIKKVDTNYKVSKDILNTIFTNINDVNSLEIKTKENINHFVIIDLPRSLPTLTDLKKYITEDDTNPRIYKNFYNVNRVFILELMKIFHIDNYENSIFNKFKTIKDMSSVNLILRLDNKYVIINLLKLLSFNKEYTLINGDTKIGSTSYMKLFHYFLKLMYNLEGNNALDIESGKYSNIIQDKIYGGSKQILNIDNINNDDINLVDIDSVELDNSEDDNSNNDDSKLIEQVLKIEDAEVKKEVVKEKHNNIEKVIDGKNNDIVSELIVEMDYKIDNKKRRKDMDKHLEELLKKESPFKNGKTYEEMLTYTKDDININEKDKVLPDSDVIFNKNLLIDGSHNFDKHYISKVYQKDILNTMFSIQKSGMLIKDYNIDTYEDILGKYENHTITFKNFNKGTTTIKFKLPIVNEDGIFKISGNSYRMKLSKLDLPLDKINSNRVALTTAYSKMFIDKAPYKKIDRGYKIRQALVKKQMEGIVNNIVLMENSVYDINLPSDYSNTMRYVSSFNYKDYSFFFDYKNRDTLLKNIKLKDIEKDKILIGTIKDGYLLIDKDNNVYTYKNKKYVLIDRLLNILEIDINNLVKEYALIKISKTYIPIVYILSYYLTFDKLLKSLNVNVEEVDIGKRITSDENSIIVKFTDTKLKITFKDDKSRVILAGLDYYSKINKTFNRDTLNNKDSMDGIFKEFGLRLLDITNIKNLETLFVDPVSATILREMNEPETFIGLLYRSAELLVDDHYFKPNSKNGFLVKGYEKIAQMIYNQLVLSVKDRDNRSVFGDAKLTVDPYSVWRAMNEDSTSVLIDDINPIAYLKQKENITSTGFMGRGKDTMSKNTREVLEEDIGIISEAGVDSGDVGINAFLSANPKIKNIRGMKDNANNKLDVSNVFSTSALLAPFSTYDDPKRLVFTGVMNSHVLAMHNANVYPIRTGYESLLPYKLDKKFIGYATEDGIVDKVMKNKIIVKYKDNKITYSFKDWTSKEESGASWLHEMQSNINVGDKVKNGDILYFDKSFFSVDIFNSKRVVYKTYMTVRTALDERNGSYEDSGIINSNFSKEASIDSIKVRSIVLDKDDIINNIVKVNDKVEPNDILFNISTGLVDTGELSEESMDLLQSFVKNSPKAKLKGKIEKIILYYNCDKNSLSKSFKKLLEESEQYMVDPFTNEKFTGEVNSSYSINGVPLDINKVELKIYIRTSSGMGTGDKGILGNQLKFTVGEIVSDIKTKDDNKDIDVIFSARSLSARIVNSPYLMGTTAYLLEYLEDEIVDMYFN